MKNDIEEIEAPRPPSALARLGWGLVLSSMIATPAFPAQTDISATPITATSGAQIKPNIMMLMDTSYSMGWTHMPDEMEEQVGLDSIGYKAAQCNALFYSPGITYKPPKNADGTPFPTPSFTAARYDAFDTANTATVNLSQHFQAYDTLTLRTSGYNDHGPTVQPADFVPDTNGTAAYYYVKSGGTVPITAYNSSPCLDPDPWTNTSPGVTVTRTSSDNGTWTRVFVGPGEQANFAMWYAYYRTRILLMKTAASIAFLPLTDSFRVGFITVKPKDNPEDAEINQAKYLAIDDFNTVQRGKWYDKLFQQKPSGSSPTREGLARVGRHFAGMHDGINAGMAGDPVQYSCQQNFTIMTTDGYWNTADESTNLGGGYIGGPVDISGKLLVAGDGRNPDGARDADSTNNPSPRPAADYNVTPRPMWDGTFDGLRTKRTRSVHYEYRACGTYFNKTDTVRNRSTSQILKVSTKSRIRTHQELQSTEQVLKTEEQTLYDSSQPRKRTVQHLESTRQEQQDSFQKKQSSLQDIETRDQTSKKTHQNRASTYQNLANTRQDVEIKTRVEKSVWIPRQSTQQTLRSSSQLLKSTAQLNVQTVQHLKTSRQNRYRIEWTGKDTSQTVTRVEQRQQRTHQVLQRTQYTTKRTTQRTRTTKQISLSTHKVEKSTAQRTMTTSQVFRSTLQVRACNARGENCVPGPVNDCVQGPTVTCETIRTGPLLVDACEDQPASGGNNYRATTCTTRTDPTIAVETCSNEDAAPGNGYTKRTCNTVTTGPTPVAFCLEQPALAGNTYTATTCRETNTGPTFVASCDAQPAQESNGYVQTLCSTDTRGPVGVESCPANIPASESNDYLQTICADNNTAEVPVQTCGSSSSGNEGNSWVTTTCTPYNPEVAVGTCSRQTPSSSNGWKDITCRSVDSDWTGVETCSPVPAGTGNTWTATECQDYRPADVGTENCTPIDKSEGNSWTKTSCPTITTSVAIVPYGSCNAADRSSGNSWTTTTCPPGRGDWVAYPTTCFPSGVYGPTYYYRCEANDSVDVPVATCDGALPSYANGYTRVTCRDNNSTPTPTGSCNPVDPVESNSYTATTCPVLRTTDEGSETCNNDPTPTVDNNYKTTSCRTATTTDVPVQTCSRQTGSSSNSWLNVTCRQNDTTNVAVASCTASPARDVNAWTTTTCPPETLDSPPVVVENCSPVDASSGNGFRRTDCNTITVTTPVAEGTCRTDPATEANGWVGTTCATRTASVPVLNCTRIPPSESNNWTETTCGTNNRINFPVLGCSGPIDPVAGNDWTRTVCESPVDTAPVFVESCSYIGPNIGNDYVETTCDRQTSTRGVPMGTCSRQTAAGGNSWLGIECGNRNTAPTAVNPALCRNESPEDGNGWTTYICTDNNQYNQPVARCSDTPATGPSWTRTACAAPVIVTDRPALACNEERTATETNGYTTRTCRDVTTDVASGSCETQSPAFGNDFVQISCVTVVEPRRGAETCNAQPGDEAHDWKTINCTPNNSTDVPSETCERQTRSDRNGWTERTCRTARTTDIAVPGCSRSDPTGLNRWTRTTCRVVDTDDPSGDCRTIDPVEGNGWKTTSCPTVVVSGGAAECTAQPSDADHRWERIECPGIRTTGPIADGRCEARSADSTNDWTTTTCRDVVTGPVVSTTCVRADAAEGNGWTKTECAPLSGKMETARTSMRTQVFNVSGRSTSLVSDNTVDGAAVDSSACYAPGAEPALPADGYAAWTAADATAYPSCTEWPCTIDVNTGGPRSLNSLADVAQYYYVTDLRTAANEPRGPDFYRDDVPAVGSGLEDDRAPWQHMTTMGIALGVSGTLKYQSDYRVAATGDFARIRCEDESRGGTCKNWPLWPDPSPGFYSNPNAYADPRSIDDFWHAAVNGRGPFFSAANPDTVVDGLAAALAGITARVAASTGAGASNLQPVTGDNFAYLANYETQKWTGDVEAHEINVTTGNIESAVIWSARSKLDALVGQACDNRKILLYRDSATDKVVDFTWGSQICDTGSMTPTGGPRTALDATEKDFFTGTAVTLLSQYPSMSTSAPDQRSAAAGINLVNYLRGQRGNEDFTTGVANRLYRKREHVLGVIIDGQPTYVRRPFATFAENNYNQFKTDNAGRTPMLYVAANDGMLHAFYAGTSVSDAQGGKEAWAFIPTAVLPRLYKLADANYKNIHEYYVDGTPTVSDVWDGTAWKTILVGGLNSGGRGYYALDITNPESPKGLWEFGWGTSCFDPGDTSAQKSDCHLGLTFGKPIITKLADQRWVVLVTSGYNNVNPTPRPGDGQGYLYVLEASTGKILYKISTGAGDATTPSGLAQLNNFVEKAELDNTTLRVYGTDVLGNIWRFDVNDTSGPSGREATLVGTAVEPRTTGTPDPQPITTRVELSKLGDQPMLFVATGRLLGASDVLNQQKQSVYGFVDPLTEPISPATAVYPDLRASLAPLTMTQVGTGPGAFRRVACNGTATQCGSKLGWRVDLLDAGERVNVEMKLRERTLIFGSNVPTPSGCAPGGYSWLNYLDYKTGLALATAVNNEVTVQVANSLIVGLTVIKLQDGTIRAISTTANAGYVVQRTPIPRDTTSGKRISWREVPAN